MSDLVLNLRQKKLLQQLVELKESKQLKEPFTPFPLDLMNYVVYLRSRYNLRIQWISDLEVLCLAGYLDYEWNRMWTAKKYRINGLALTTVADKEFITAADYTRERSIQSTSQLFPDPKESPPLDQSLDYLFIADLSTLTRSLKRILGELFEGEELGDLVAEVAWIISNLNSGDSNSLPIGDSINKIGQTILRQAIVDIGSPSAQKFSYALAVFALWNKELASKLAMLAQNKLV